MAERDERAMAVLLAVFVAHNLEEIWQLPRDVDDLREVTGLELAWLDRSTFGVATTLLTAVVAGLLAASRRVDDDDAREFLATAASSALAGNAATHGLRALVRRRYNGGLLTAPLLWWSGLRVIRGAQGSLSSSERSRVHVVANLGAIPLILAALTAGRVLTHHRRNPS